MEFDTVVIGGGPAGTGIFMKSIKDDSLDQILSRGVCVIEQSDGLVTGTLPSYKVNSDTRSEVFLECLEGAASRSFSATRLQKSVGIIENYSSGSIPLAQTKLFLDELGLQLYKLIEQHPGSRVLLNTKVEEVRQMEGEGYEIATENQAVISAKNIILACGGIPKLIGIAGGHSGKIVHSDQVIRGKADDLIQGLNRTEKIVILGGSHSAFSVAHYLLNVHDAKCSEEYPIEIWARKVPKIFFPTPESAIEHGYTDFSEKDVCSVTQRVFRLAGLRMDGRRLCMDMLGIGGEVKEKRVALKMIEHEGQIDPEILHNAGLVIEATGYAFNIPKFFTQNHEQVSFQGEKTLHWVDQHCRLLLKDGTPLKNAYAVGLATGFIPKNDLGGEKSFQGQTNGLWYYQNIIAEIILNNLFNESAPAVS